MSNRTKISCNESDLLRPNLCPSSSRTNFIGGEVLDDRRPPDTYTEWSDEDSDEVRLIDLLNTDGCKHWKVDTDE